MKDLISVIVPVYKVEKYLPKCIESIINQTYKNLEIILVDDGSPDNCGRICDEYSKKDKRIKVIHKINEGVSAARNFGIKACLGDFVAFVDGDDFLQPEMYEEMLSKQKEQNADLVFCMYNIVKQKTTQPVQEEMLKKSKQNSDIIKCFFTHQKRSLKDNIIIEEQNILSTVWRILCKKQSLNNIQFNPRLKFMEDQVFMIKLLMKDLSVAVVDEPLYNYLIREDSASQNNIDGLIENCKSYITAIKDMFLNSDYSFLIPSIEFSCYSQCVTAGARLNKKIVVNDIKEWNSKSNYKANKLLTHSFKDKVKFFLAHHNCRTLLRLFYGLKG